MALSIKPYDSFSRASDYMMHEIEYRMQRQMEKMQYQMQMNMAYPMYQGNISPVSTPPQKDEKKEKLHRLIAHYYHLRK